jgi:hypothetical protein
LQERNSVKGKELRLLWLKIEGFGERIEEAVEGEGRQRREKRDLGKFLEKMRERKREKK